MAHLPYTGCYQQLRLLIKKPNLRKDLKYYRPVNNLCIIWKYVEKAMLEQLNAYMTTWNLIPDYISAYRKKNFSTETVLVKIHHEILKAFEEQKGVLLTGLDLSAAYWYCGSWHLNKWSWKHVWLWLTGIWVVQGLFKKQGSASINWK